MKDVIVSFDTAKLAKEKYFDISCKKVYDTLGKLWNSYYATMNNNNVDRGAECTAPTQSLLQKWLREVHNISIWASTGWYMSKLIYEVEISYIDKDGKFKEITPILPNYSSLEYRDTYSDSYEEALEIGLQEGLKLIPV